MQSKKLHYISEGRREFELDDLGLAAYEKNNEVVRAALAKEIDWSTDGEYLFAGAYQGENWEIMRELILAGMPTDESIYRALLSFAQDDLVALLPPRPDWIAKYRSDMKFSGLCRALLEDENEKVPALIDPKRINEYDEYGVMYEKMTPLHFAAYRANIDALKHILLAGGNIHLLTGKGRSAMRLVAERAGFDNRTRRECLTFLKAHGGIFEPPLKGGWLSRWQIQRGQFLHERE